MNEIKQNRYRTPWPLHRLAALLCLFCLGFGADLVAQTQGGIAGTATDQTKSVLKGVKVVATQDATGLMETVVTDSGGLYALPLLAPGSYSLRFSLEGFQTVLVHATVVVSETVPVDVVLPVGNISMQITINEQDAALLQTSASSLGRVVDEKQVQNLPLATRNFTQLMALSPGASSVVNDATATGRGTQVIYDNGARSVSNSLTIDGIDADNIHTNSLAQNTVGSNGVTIPSPEAIQEFKVQTGLYDAEYGRNGGANTSLITRSGSSQYHGAAYEYFRNTVLDANTYFFRANSLPRAILNQNQFGAVFGGPIPKVKNTFFFASYQGTTQTDGIASSKTLSLPAGLFGISRTASAIGAAYAGQTGANAAAGGTLAIAADGSNISPVALALLNYKLPGGDYLIPSPQTAATANNYSVSIPSTFREDGWILNLDHAFGAKNTLSAKGFIMNDPQFNAFPLANLPGFGQTQEFKSRGVNFSDMHIFSGAIVNEARAGLIRTIGNLNTQTSIPLSSIGMMRSNSSVFPTIPSITVAGGKGAFELGYSADGNEGGSQNTLEYTDTVAIVKSRHSFRIGGEIRHYQDNFFDYNFTLGAMTLYSFTDFLLGRPAGPIVSGGNGSPTLGALSSSAVSTTNALRNDRLTDYTLFIQDDYRMSSRLTWNIGLRWDRMGMGVDRSGRNGNFVPSLYAPPPPGGSTSAGFVQPSNAATPLGLPLVSPTFLNHAQWKNFAPRIGFAYALTPKIVLHGGYGIYFDRLSNQISVRLSLAPPNYLKSTLTAANAGSLSFANPFATLPLPSQLPQAPKLFDPFTFPATSLLATDAVDPNLATPYMSQYTVSMQWQVQNDLLLEAGYVGSKGTKLPGQQYINQAQLATSTAPVNGVTVNTTANINERVPFLGISANGLTYLLTNEDSRYNSLQVSATKSLRRGLQFLASYTFSRSVDDASGASATVFNNPTGDQDNLQNATGRSDFDRPSRFVVSGLYAAPYLGFDLRKNLLTREALEGWQVAWVTVLQSGTPYSITDTNGAAFYGTGESLASYAPGANSATAKKSGSVTSRLTGYFNTSAFAPAGNLYGNVSRNSLRGPGQANWDLSVLKNFSLPEKTNFQFRAEFFNVFNHTNFANPGSAISTSSTFGVISSTVGNPRILQLTARLSF